jgi:hypothetical protein
MATEYEVESDLLEACELRVTNEVTGITTSLRQTAAKMENILYGPLNEKAVADGSAYTTMVGKVLEELQGALGNIHPGSLVRAAAEADAAARKAREKS